MNSKSAWIEAAKKELRGKDPFGSLAKSWNSFEILPYYSKSDLDFNACAISGRQVFSPDGPNNWLNLPEVDAASVNANSITLNHLQNGADGVVFSSIGDRPGNEIKDIKPEHCFLGFEAAGSDLKFFVTLRDTIPKDKLIGSIFWDGAQNWLHVANLFKGYDSFRCFGIAEAGEGVFDQLFSCTDGAIQVLDTLTDYAFNPQTILRQLAFMVNSTADFFGDVIKIRSLRILLNRISQAYGVEKATSFIRVKVSPFITDSYQPHGDLVGNSFATMAAISASVDAVTINTVNHQSALHTSTVRNISLLLKEESRFDKVVDPFAGSYFIESLTNSLVEKVWDTIKSKS